MAMPDFVSQSSAYAAYLAAIVDSSHDAILSKDLAGVIQTWNKAAEQIFGYTASEAIGQSILLIIPPELHEEEATILRRVQQGERIEHFETVRRRKDGRLIDIALTVSPVRDADGHIRGASKIARDITEWKQSQRAAAEAHARLAVTLQSIGDAVLATDVHAQVTYLNPVAAQVLGASYEQIIGRPLGDVLRIVNQETRRPADNPVDRVLREGITTGLANHTVLLRSNGSEVPIDDSAAPIKDSDGNLLGVVLVFRDVSARYQASRQAAILSAIVSSSDDAILSKDLAGVIQTWNKAAERIFGYTASEAIGQSILLMIPPELHEEEAMILARLQRGERIEHYETVRRRKDGRLVDISLSVSPLTNEEGRVIGASKIARDITEQKRAQEALRESEERWRVTLESVGDAVVVTDSSAQVTLVNSVASKLMGRPKGDILGRPLTEVFPIFNEKTRQRVDNPVERVLREGIVVGLANHTILVRPDGSEVPIDDSAAPVRDLKDQLLGVVLVFRDITARKQAELQSERWNVELEARIQDRTQALLRSQEQLRGLTAQLSLTEHRERLRLATDLHDSVAQSLALTRIKLWQLKQHATGAMSTALGELEDLVQECLTFTRTVMTQLSPSILHDFGLVQALRWLAEQMNRQGLTVEVQDSLAEGFPRLGEDREGLLFQTVRELLFNVLKHAQVSRATVTLEQEGTQAWQIAVSDKGVGFDLNHVQYRRSGDHFGLFTLQQRMESISGWCLIESAPGAGTTIRLGFPTHPPAPLTPPVEKPSSIDSSLPDVRWRVLVVDDHAMIRQGLRSVLNTYPDLEVIAEAIDGEEAVACALREQPDVVVMDITLPRLTGVEATRLIKQARPATLVIGLSVQVTAQRHDAMLAAGAAAVLSKEEATEDLYTIITQFLHKPEGPRRD